ncbi:MAG: glutathione S-transferase N-terminal domain-containing protein [Deltaproteobacteria bacterium]|nr:glutathione S-transferase N-terminal domain-containing protein [Deltaproteobacteria bacterium]
MDRTLVVLPVSPWSERARWALDHHRLPFRTVEHSPFLGERKLRKLVGPTPTRATVPVLIEGAQRFMSSTEIARHADRIGSGTPLFPAGRDDELNAWIKIADDAFDSARVLVTLGLLASPAALDETLPPALPRWLRPLLRPVTRYGTRWFARKYGLSVDDVAAAEVAGRQVLEVVRAGLAKSGPYLLGTFSYADIVIALLLQPVRPVQHERYPLGPATRELWTSSSSSAYSDLLEWRDALYARHRVPSSSSAA